MTRPLWTKVDQGSRQTARSRPLDEVDAFDPRDVRSHESVQQRRDRRAQRAGTTAWMISVRAVLAPVPMASAPAPKSSSAVVAPVADQIQPCARATRTASCRLAAPSLAVAEER
jgi:hypothetical protein